MRLEAVANRFISRAYRISDSQPIDCPIAPFAVINLYAEWELFNFKLLVTSTLKKPTRSDGSVVSSGVGIKTTAEFDKALIPIFSPSKMKRRILYWGDPGTVVRAAAGLKLSNAPSISAAIGSIGSPADSIRTTRNYLAHWNEETHRKLPGHLSGGNSAILLDRLGTNITGGIREFDSWVFSLQDIARQSCV
jgi:hypothetical protein